MSTRLASGGRRIDRDAPLKFAFNGKKLKGYSGDTVASALLASNQLLVGRSFKYHRPRGIVSCGPEEPNALLGVGEGATFTPNQRATTTELSDGMTISSQNHWPSLEFDVGEIASAASVLLPAGFYYKTFMHPRPAWKHLFEPMIRRAAGLGQAPKGRDPDLYEHFHAHVDVLVIGGGVAGLSAAKAAAGVGARVLIIEQEASWGGRAAKDGAQVEGQSAEVWLDDAINQLNAFGNVRMAARTVGIGAYDHGYVLACQQHAGGRFDQRLWRIRARKTILATGALERPLCFAGNDVPGVMLSSAVRDYLSDFGVSPGDRVAVLANNDDAYLTAVKIAESGLSVPAVLDVRQSAEGPNLERARELGINVEFGKGIASVKGRSRVSGVAVCAYAGEGAVLSEIECEAVAMSGGWSPTVHLWSHCGGKLRWDERQAMFRPLEDKPPVNDDGQPAMQVVGAANGEMSTGRILQDAKYAAAKVLSELGFKTEELEKPGIEPDPDYVVKHAWLVPQGMKPRSKSKSWVDFQNDVKVSDVEIAAQEGYRSVEHLKRYTTLGMATDQGKLSNINGLAVLADRLGAPIGEVGTTTFRPPYVPVTLGAIAGDAKGKLFKPTRKTPIDAWHDRNGAFWEPVGSWRRPYCYRRADESVADAVNRETVRVRTSVGVMDASTLGKLLVSGPDAGKFLDVIYTGKISTLKPGRCRYGLMCNENGFLMDDGVVARMSDDSFLCHTTTGGADHVHSWMEEWLQCEWWDWKVHVVNLTEQFAQIVVAGPDSRRLLEKITGGGIDADEFPFMAWKRISGGGLDLNVFRISFSGELSFEIAIRASQGRELWDRILECGREFDAEPYGTEALHVLRAEKGYVMIGDESDGTVTPQDLGLDWAVSKSKDDYLGKRAQERSYLTNPSRWKLVGLELTDGKDPLPCGVHAISNERNMHGRPRAVGRVTSSYYSPNLERPIALGLVERGPERMGEILEFPLDEGSMKAKIVRPVFYDPEGAKLRG